MEPAKSDRLHRQVEREKRARLEAEKLLEEKSLSLYEANQKLAQANLKQKGTVEELKAILDNFPRGVLIANVDGIIETINSQAVQMFGTTMKMVTGQDVNMLLPNLPDISDPSQVKTAINTGDLRIEGLRPDQSKFPVEIAFTAIGEGESTRTIWMIRDISDRLAADISDRLAADISDRLAVDKERQRLNKKLRQAQKLESLGTLAGGIAHELNTPIQFVTDNMNFLSDTVVNLLKAMNELGDFVSTEKKTEVTDKFDLEYIADEAPQAIQQSVDGLKRIAHIVLAIKKFSHPTSPSKIKNDLNDIIRTTSTVSKNQWKYVAKLDLKLEESLPAIFSNAGELNQVFLNLIVNAAHAIEDEVGRDSNGLITIETGKRNGAVECRISDNGTGIPKDVLAKVFDPFFTTKDPGRGTGQGLAIVHSIVTQSHDGEISIESKSGEGTTITLTFPIESAEIDASKTPY